MSNQEMPTKDAGVHKALKEERFEYVNSGFAHACVGDYESARQLALRMLESAMRVQGAPVKFKEEHVPENSAVKQTGHSVW